MGKSEEGSELFYKYYERWIRIYKEGAIREVTMKKYEITLTWLEKLVPELRLSELNRSAYQQLLNDYAMYHERQTTMDFHHQLKAAVLDDTLTETQRGRPLLKGRRPGKRKLST